MKSSGHGHIKQIQTVYPVVQKDDMIYDLMNAQPLESSTKLQKCNWIPSHTVRLQCDVAFALAFIGVLVVGVLTGEGSLFQPGCIFGRGVGTETTGHIKCKSNLRNSSKELL